MTSPPAGTLKWRFSTERDFGHSKEYRVFARGFRIRVVFGVVVGAATLAFLYGLPSAVTAQRVRDLFTREAIATWMAASGSGLSVVLAPLILVWGLVAGTRTARRGLRSYGFAHAIAQHVARGCDAKLAAVARGEKPKVSAVWDEILPTLAPHEATPRTLIALRQAADFALWRRFDAERAVTQFGSPLADESLVRLDSVKRIALYGGILGTFLGLMLALRSALSALGGPAPDTLSEMPADLEPFVNSLSSNLFVGFGTSIAGLVVALSCTLWSRFVRTHRLEALRAYETAVQRVADVMRASFDDRRLFHELAQLSARIDSVAESLDVKAAAMAEKVERAADVVLAQTDTIKAGLSGLAAARVSLDASLKKTADQVVQDAFATVVQQLKEMKSQLAALSAQHAREPEPRRVIGMGGVARAWPLGRRIAERTPTRMGLVVPVVGAVALVAIVWAILA